MDRSRPHTVSVTAATGDHGCTVKSAGRAEVAPARRGSVSRHQKQEVGRGYRAAEQRKSSGQRSPGQQPVNPCLPPVPSPLCFCYHAYILTTDPDAGTLAPLFLPAPVWPSPSPALPAQSPLRSSVHTGDGALQQRFACTTSHSQLLFFYLALAAGTETRRFLSYY